jgi:hydroxyethylthiazole kinase-like uncharacterized protein yjeF
MSVPVLTIAQMRAWEESTWSAGGTPDRIIARVGSLLGEQLLRLTSPKQKILILAGKGNNGADARATMQHVLARSPLILNVEDPDQAFAEFQEALKDKPDLIVDGLFGTGLNRPLALNWIRFVGAVNQSGVPIAAVDIPSGLNADTGQPQGTAIRATWTFSVGAIKRGLLMHPAAPHVGRLVLLEDVGLDANPSFDTDLIWTTTSDFRAFPPRREVQTHKGTYGHAIICAGSVGYHGAAVLAARGAQRAQPGLVSVFTQEGCYIPVASQIQAAMVAPWKPGGMLPARATAMLYGPGLASPNVHSAMRDELRWNWSNLPLPVIVDASALEWLPEGPTPADAVRVITPHPGEAAALLRTETETVQHDRVGAVRSLSTKYGGCQVVLKGHHTLIGREAGVIRVNGTGGPALAQGGSGDLLAGFVTGLLAQPQLASSSDLALAYAVWAHGHAADLLTAARPNWIIEELADQIGLRQ